jgi:hypothetical protein
MGIFEDVSRTYLGPANHGEPHWTFLNRSARAESRKARERIEDWFEQLCPALQHGVRDLLRSGDNQKFAAGFWELYLHALFGGLGYDVTCASPTGNGRNIDFLMRRENSAFYLEATIARKSAAERAADARRDRIYRELDKLRALNFTLGITIVSAGPHDMKNVGVLRHRLEDWLETLDPASAEPQ